jgi:hypothetical protein
MRFKLAGIALSFRVRVRVRLRVSGKVINPQQIAGIALSFMVRVRVRIGLRVRLRLRVNDRNPQQLACSLVVRNRAFYSNSIGRRSLPNHPYVSILKYSMICSDCTMCIREMPFVCPVSYRWYLGIWSNAAGTRWIQSLIINDKLDEVAAVVDAVAAGVAAVDVVVGGGAYPGGPPAPPPTPAINRWQKQLSKLVHSASQPSSGLIRSNQALRCRKP